MQRRPLLQPYGGRSLVRSIVTAAQAGRNLFNRRVTLPSRTTATQGVSGAPGQSSTRTTYKKRRVSRRGGKRRRYAKRSRRQYMSNLIKDLGTNSVMFNQAVAEVVIPAAPNGSQNYTNCIYLYGGNGTSVGNENGALDMKRICDNWTPADSRNEKVIISNGHLDITFANTSTTQGKLEVDVYWIAIKKGSTIPNISQAFIDAENATPLMTGATQFADYTLQDRGATPWQFPAALSRGMKIIKKVKHFVPAGGYFTEQWNDTKNTWLSVNDLGTDEVAFKGKTIACFFITKTVIGNSEETKFRIGGTRTYTLKVLQSNADVNGRWNL